MRSLTISLLFAVMPLCSCGGRKADTALRYEEVQDTTANDASTIKITAEMAFEGVNNYCHEEFDWSISKDNPDIMYVQMGEESDKEYQVVFRSYTGAFTYFHVDKQTGKTRMLEKVSNLGVEEETGTINLHDYLGKGNSSKAAASDREDAATAAILTGHFVSDDDGSTLTITIRDDDRYDIKIDIFRLTSLDDGVGSEADGGIDFNATDAAGEPIGGRITFADDIATLTFIHSTWSLIEEGTTWEFKRK